MTKITEVRVGLHEQDDPLSPGRKRQIGVLTIVTSSGIEGTTFMSGARSNAAAAARICAEVVRPQLIGADALDTGVIWQRLWAQERTLGTVVIGAVDVALWDIVGKTAGLPVHRLLGTARSTIPVYISSWVHERTEDYVAEALHYQSLGFTGYKLHPPTQLRMFRGADIPLRADIDALRAVRNAVGPDMKLMSDSPFVYTYEEALTVGKVLQELGYLWYEDPLPADDIYGYERLRKHLDIPVLATEMTGGGPYNYAQWILHSATDYLRGDVFFKGGITALMKIARAAEVFRLGFELHDGFNATGNVAGAHVAMAVPNMQFFELLTHQPTGTYGWDAFGYGLARPLHIEGGLLHAPTGAGLGCEIDWELIRKGTVAEF